MASGPRTYALVGRLRPAAARGSQPVADRRRARGRAGVRAALRRVDPGLRGGGPRRSGRGRLCGPGRGKAKHYDVVIIDTEGRFGIVEELMGQAAAIREAVDSDEVI